MIIGRFGAETDQKLGISPSLTWNARIRTCAKEETLEGTRAVILNRCYIMT